VFIFRFGVVSICVEKVMPRPNQDQTSGAQAGLMDNDNGLEKK